MTIDRGLPMYSSSRRQLLRNGVLLGTGMAASSLDLGSTPLHTVRGKIDPRKPFKRTSRFKSELVIIGMVG